ncbi:unnamed protein product [Amoebophrya sp. A25]|nr:unnamed protein product [Amoebophrya sp. A25]|eukprot:GSA25T00004304001.1
MASRPAQRERDALCIMVPPTQLMQKEIQLESHDDEHDHNRGLYFVRTASDVLPVVESEVVESTPRSAEVAKVMGLLRKQKSKMYRFYHLLTNLTSILKDRVY